MRVVRIDQVRPGDITAAQVKNEAGGTLIGSGTALTELHIRRLKTAGIDTLTLEGELAPSPGQATAAARRLEALAIRFEGVTDPVLLEIQKAAHTCLKALFPETTIQ